MRSTEKNVCLDCFGLEQINKLEKRSGRQRCCWQNFSTGINIVLSSFSSIKMIPAGVFKVPLLRSREEELQLMIIFVVAKFMLST